MREMEPAVDPVQLLQHTGWMKRLARSLVSEDQADDVVQQTWLTLLKSPPSRPATTAWLAAVVRRFAYRARRAERRRRRREKRVARQEATMMPTDPAILQRTELQKLIVSAVLDLEEPYRSTVILRYFEELRVKRIAEVQRVSAETVKTRLRRALGKLREKLDRENGGERRVWVALLGPLVCGPEPTTLTASTSREVSTTMAEPTKTWNVAVGIIGGGIAVSAKKATIATVVGVLLTAGLGGVLLWSPAEEGAKQEVSTIESSVDLTEVESDRVRTDATPSVALVPAVSGSPPHPENGEQHGSIRGRVRDRQGSVAAGVRVRAFRITKPDAFNEETALEGDTETTELGEFELTALPVGSYIVRAISSEHRPSEVRDLELTADALLDVELEVRALTGGAVGALQPYGQGPCGCEAGRVDRPRSTGDRHRRGRGGRGEAGGGGDRVPRGARPGRRCRWWLDPSLPLRDRPPLRDVPSG